jgi:hypothetical protein
MTKKVDKQKFKSKSVDIDKKNNHNKFAKFLVVSVIFLSLVVLGLFGGLLALNNNFGDTLNQVDIPEEVSQTQPVPTQITPNGVMQDTKILEQSDIEKWTGKITLAPANADKFVKDSQRACSIFPDNGDVYEVKADANPGFVDRMYISNRNLFNRQENLLENDIENNKFDKLDKFLDFDGDFLTAEEIQIKQDFELDRRKFDFTELSVFTAITRQCEFYGFGDFAVQPAVVDYPKTEKAVVYSSGSIIYVLAKKGDNYILLQSGYSEGDKFYQLVEKYRESCDVELEKAGIFEQNVFGKVCLNQKLSVDPAYKSTLLEEASRITELFKF